MNASRPEADVEYSRPGGPSKASEPPSDGPYARRSGRWLRAIQATVLVGALMLVIAEFEPLFQVRAGDSEIVVRTVSAGDHHSYALLPVAVLAIVLAWALGRGDRLDAAVTAALALLGLAALAIALVGDLPEIHRSGLLGTAATGLRNARTVAGSALYLETLGAILLLIAAAAMLATGVAVRLRTPTRGAPGGETSGS